MAAIDTAVSNDFDVSPVVVVDIGSGWVRGGLVGETVPRCELPNVWHAQLTECSGGLWTCKAQENGVHPVDRGQVKDWDSLQALLQTVLNSLSLPASYSPSLLLTRPMHSARADDLRLVQMAFESLGAACVYLARQPILALYDSGQTSGIVLDCGEGLTQIVPVYEGFEIDHAVQRKNLAGIDVTMQLQRALSRQQRNPVSVSLETARSIKESMCFVDVTSDPSSASAPEDTLSKSYTTPSGDVITVDAECWKCPEVLFRPSMGGLDGSGLTQLMNEVLSSCPVDVRGHLYNQILMAGGSTLTPGLCQRLTQDLSASTPKGQVKVIARPSPEHCSWRGGSVLGSMPTFQSLCLNRQEFQEQGERILHKKFL